MALAGSGPMRPDDRILVRGARQLITLQGPPRIRRGKELKQIGIIQDGSVLVEGGIIREVGSTRRIDNLRAAAGARTIDARGMVLIPAFVDAVTDLLPLREPPPEPDAELGYRPVGDGSESAYTTAAMNTVPKRLERELARLADAGTLYTQFQIRLPDSPALRSRLLRNLLQVDIPRHSFRAALQIAAVQAALGATELAEMLPRAALRSWKELRPSLAIGISSSSLRGIPDTERAPLLSSICGGVPLLLSRPGLMNPPDLLALCLATSATIWGNLPTARPVLEAFARFGVPWILMGTSYVFDRHAALECVREGVQAGMVLALSTGFNVNAPGSASLFDLLTIFRQSGGLPIEDLLHMSIANNAYALGVGDRLGTIEAGKEANLLLLDCGDYREIGVHLGLPRLAAILRRGLSLSLTARGTSRT